MEPHLGAMPGHGVRSWQCLLADGAGDVAHAPLGAVPLKVLTLSGHEAPGRPEVGRLGVVRPVFQPGQQVERTGPPGKELDAGHGHTCTGFHLAHDVVDRRRCAADVVGAVEQHGVGQLGQMNGLGRGVGLPDIAPRGLGDALLGQRKHVRALQSGMCAPVGIFGSSRDLSRRIINNNNI